MNNLCLKEQDNLGMPNDVLRAQNEVVRSIQSGTWKSAEARNFVLNFALVTLWASALRPINKHYDSWFRSRAQFVDLLLKRLNEPGWALTEATIEAGIAKLSSLIERNLKGQKSSGITDEVDLLSYYHFRSYDRSWSELVPVHGMTIDGDWPTPTQLFFAFGPHIGIGDEMIFFLAVEALARKFPKASIEVWSHSKGLWDWNPNIKARYISEDAMDPFVRAQALLQKDPNSLITFCDFASDKIYRMLETVPGFLRFIYIDIGSGIVRLVDQEKFQIREYEKMDGNFIIYDVLKDLLRNIGLETPALGSLIDGSYPPIQHAPARVFLNPHSSKDKEAVSAEWWVETLHHISTNHPIEVTITAGLNEGNLQFAKAIVELLDPSRVKTNILPRSELDVILKTALDNDIVIGLDTFTAHINTLRTTRCITVFFGASGRSWHVPQDSVLNLQITDDAILAGRLACRLLYPLSDPSVVQTLQALSAKTHRLEKLLTQGTTCQNAHECLNDILNLITQFFSLDPEAEKTFFEYPIAHIRSLKGVIKFPSTGQTISPLQKDVLTAGLNGWKNSNLSRYAKYVAKQSPEPLETLNKSANRPSHDHAGALSMN